MKIKTIPEINMTDNPLDNIIKMAPYLDEGSQRTVFGMMLEAVMSIKDIPQIVFVNIQQHNPF